jgi:hypothetical protein
MLDEYNLDEIRGLMPDWVNLQLILLLEHLLYIFHNS